MSKKSTGSAKRFGNRYGRKNREKVGAIEAQYKKPQKSPFSNKHTVKRIASGIYRDTKTGHVFTGRAYSAKRTEVKS